MSTTLSRIYTVLFLKVHHWNIGNLHSTGASFYYNTDIKYSQFLVLMYNFGYTDSNAI
jgi:hypothetical protein